MSWNVEKVFEPRRGLSIVVVDGPDASGVAPVRLDLVTNDLVKIRQRLASREEPKYLQALPWLDPS